MCDYGFLRFGENFSEKTVNLVTQILKSEILIIFWKKVSLLPKPQFTINLICVVRGKWTLTLTRWLSRDGECDLLVPLYVIFTQLFKWKKVFLMTDRIDTTLLLNLE